MNFDARVRYFDVGNKAELCESFVKEAGLTSQYALRQTGVDGGS